MNTASLQLCKELFELTGWKATAEGWLFYGPQGDLRTRLDLLNTDYTADMICPVYDLGYLLRKLPEGTSILKKYGGGYNIDYNMEFSIDDDTPEDCIARFAIELFKQGVLKHEKD